MSMKKNITIDGQEVAFKASAAIPRIYRMRFHRDIYKDLRDLEKGIDKNDPENSNLVLPQIIELWGLNTQTDAQAKKNFARLTGK